MHTAGLPDIIVPRNNSGPFLHFVCPCDLILKNSGEEHVVGVHGDVNPDGVNQLEVQGPVDQQRVDDGERHRHAPLLLQEHRPGRGLREE